MADESRLPAANRMLGSQPVSKTIIQSPPPTSLAKSQPKPHQPATKDHEAQRSAKSPARTGSVPTSQTVTTAAHPETTSPPAATTKPHELPPTQIPKCKKSPELKKTAPMIANLDDGQQQQQQQQQVACPAPASGSSAKELQLLTKEAQDLKTRTRKLQLEIDEKNEIINVLKDELETLREQNDKYHRDSIQLIKDSKRVKFLQDENDFLQDKVGQVEVLELEVKRLKERLNETDFLKIRVTELEEDLAKAREESNQFEDKWQEAESKLTRVPELEAELNKWKSFSQELESEKDSIQTKLLESIDHEAKLDSDNKKVEAEVRRLRDLIKVYEEQRDEEQASNSLIMSVADLKLLDDQHHSEEKVLLEAGTNTESAHVQVQEMGQQTDTSDTAEKSCETDQLNMLEFEQRHKVGQEFIKTLQAENGSLKSELKTQEERVLSLVDSNKQILNEIDGNRRLISDLRQDLACEKSLTQKLTTQLTSFNKQIKSLDKQYFPIHDSTEKTKKLQADSEQPTSNQSKLSENSGCGQKSATTGATNVSTHTQTRDKVTEKAKAIGNLDGTDVSRRISPPVHCTNGLKEDLPLPASDFRNGQLTKKESTTPKPSANLSFTADKNAALDRARHDEMIPRGEGDCLKNSKLTRSPTPVKSHQSLERDNKSNFVRNAMPSRSVNFGHSKSSAHLERIRASVTATATTSSTTSFNEQTTKNFTSTAVGQPAVGLSANPKPGFVLNCMLNHHHSERCFATIERPTRIQVSQPANVSHTNPGFQQAQYQQMGNHRVHEIQQPHQAMPCANGVSTSRQLNALIDPVANDQLLMNVLHQQMISQQQQSGLPSTSQLTEQQIAHLNNLKRQHYYHHLHQLHQIHHLHQLHHLHHKCKQQQQQQNLNHQAQHLKADPVASTAEINGMIGSQFYAPIYDQVYANMTANNNNNNDVPNQASEYASRKQNGTRLVNNESDLGATAAQKQDYKHLSSQRTAPASSMYHHQISHTKLAQIDELGNSVPIGTDPRSYVLQNDKYASKKHMHPSPTNSSLDAGNVNQHDRAPNGTPGKQRQQDSPALSSPTSSRTSSNISPSSEASSSSTSSTNSLTTSVPLTRSALRHTSTDLNRRQYSVERDLTSSTPLTATLSRVGSCRSAMNNQYQLVNQEQVTAPRDMSTLMRNPVQSQQPAMRTSKILSIGSQQQANTSGSASGVSEQNLLTSNRDSKKFSNGVSSVANEFNRSTANNMANIRLNDNLAFASLRVPKKSSSGSNLNSSLIAVAAAAAARNVRSINSKVSSTSSSPDKARSIKTSQTSLPNSGASNTGNGNSTNNNNGHPSVWYEYGCI